jgi:hypothetical protein
MGVATAWLCERCFISFSRFPSFVLKLLGLLMIDVNMEWIAKLEEEIILLLIYLGV